MSADFGAAQWVEGPLLALSARIRRATRAALTDAVANGVTSSLARPHGVGAGDVTYAIDVPAENEVARWFDEVTRREPLSLLTEDAGWRHQGPDGRGGTRLLEGFHHGGARIAVDPIDGTRNLMADLRPAWSVIALCGPGAGTPRMSEVCGAVLSEIPDSRAARARTFRAACGSLRLSHESLPDGVARAEGEWRTDEDDRADNGYFPFFRYMADMRPEVARIEAEFFARLERDEQADVRTCWDDQYISNGGQLALLTLGTYRMVADLRAHLAARRGRPTLTCKPYDCAGAIFVARSAGCVVTAAGGGALDFELDVVTPVSFVGWVNERTRGRLERHLNAVLERR